ncbi:MAG: NADH-quinone oxidoreductase subunit NuoG, partial [Actinobacteria bacterium]|nr:NADH-quinone oxidoreductase subunit NuoG [Actinomycetota bacterium]
MTDTNQEISTVQVSIDGRAVAARKGELVIDAAERNDVYIPRFCYHNRMNPVGMCRMCLVEIDTGRGPALQPSCMIECSEGMTVATDTPTVVKAQEGVLEFLLINHPLDCPVCDKGGECPLQDQTMSHGPGESRYVEEKRHKEKPINVSELVLLDRERCILCDRCTRFAKEVAGDPLIHFLNRGNTTEVNTFPDHEFASYFSGNTVQICPVGALTSTPYRFKARPWDLAQTESTCTGCSVGCRIVIDTSRDELLRFNGVDSDPVNWSWLCDKGRFGFEAYERGDRLVDPTVRSDAQSAPKPVGWNDALDAAAAAIGETDAARIGVIGGAQLTNEAQFAWAKLAKGIIGTDNVDAQLGDGLDPRLVLALPPATIAETCAPGGTILVFANDVKEELGVLYLRLRHAAVWDRATVVEVSATTTGITPFAAASTRVRPGAAPEVIAAMLNGGPAPEGADAETFAEAARLLAGHGDGPLRVVLGRASAAESADVVTAVAHRILAARPDATFLTTPRRANVRGAIDMGLVPGFLPGRVTLESGRSAVGAGWGVAANELPSSAGLDTRGILEAAAAGKIDTLVLLGADPVADFADRSLAERALKAADHVIAVDLFENASNRLADIVLPAAGLGAEDGTTTNLEGRVTRVRQAVAPPGRAHADWVIAAELALTMGADLGFETPEDIRAEIART